MTLDLTTALHEKYRYIYNETVKNRLKYIYVDYYGTSLIYQPINQHENSLEFFMDLFQAMRIMKRDLLNNLAQIHRRFNKELEIMKQKRRQIEVVKRLPCGTQVENYKNCINHIIYCSFDCLTVILLRKMNDQKARNFDEACFDSNAIDPNDPDEIMLYDE